MAANPVKRRTGALLMARCVSIHIFSQLAQLALGEAHASTQG